MCRAAEERVGGLSNPSKMPGYGYSLPASRCRRGSDLRKEPGSVCEKCYACKGRYMFPNVGNAMDRRLRSLSSDTWVDDMVDTIGRKCGREPYFRFHDSGDLQDYAHLLKIAQIAANLPRIRFWLPTLEVDTVANFIENSIDIPDNLNIRISTPFINEFYEQKSLELSQQPGITLSSVVTPDRAADMPKRYVCPATAGRSECGSCRKCWNRSIKTVVYIKH